MAEIPDSAATVCTRYLAAMEDAEPGLLAGLYLVGSIALGDYREGSSDIDFIAVTSRPVSAAEIAPIHAALSRNGPSFDGIYVTADELTHPAGGAGVAIVAGRIHPDAAAERHAVTWLTLARHGVAIAGPPVSTLRIATSIDHAKRHARHNLQTYWSGWLTGHSRLISRAGLESLSADAVAWSVLGVSRLHATIATDQLLSKTAAGHYARDAFPQHRLIIEHALALRRGAVTPFIDGVFARRRAMLSFVDAAITDGLAVGGH